MASTSLRKSYCSRSREVIDVLSLSVTLLSGRPQNVVDKDRDGIPTMRWPLGTNDAYQQRGRTT